MYYTNLVYVHTFRGQSQSTLACLYSATIDLETFVVELHYLAWLRVVICGIYYRVKFVLLCDHYVQNICITNRTTTCNLIFICTHILISYYVPLSHFSQLVLALRLPQQRHHHQRQTTPQTVSTKTRPQ